MPPVKRTRAKLPSHCGRVSHDHSSAILNFSYINPLYAPGTFMSLNGLITLRKNRNWRVKGKLIKANFTNFLNFNLQKDEKLYAQHKIWFSRMWKKICIFSQHVKGGGHLEFVHISLQGQRQSEPLRDTVGCSVKWGAGTKLVQCWPTVANAGPTLYQRCVDIIWFRTGLCGRARLCVTGGEVGHQWSRPAYKLGLEWGRHSTVSSRFERFRGHSQSRPTLISLLYHPEFTDFVIVISSLFSRCSNFVTYWSRTHTHHSSRHSHTSRVRLATGVKMFDPPALTLEGSFMVYFYGKWVIASFWSVNHLSSCHLEWKHSRL